MLIRHTAGIRPSEITPHSLYLRRREVLSGVAAAAAAIWMPGTQACAATPLPAVKSPFSTPEPLTAREDVTSYNNFYEFGTGKRDPAAYAGALTIHPWSVKVDGLVAKPATYAIEDLLTRFPLEERIYRLRCVEGWSMVIPWTGFPLAALLKLVEPLGSAKFVSFQSLLRPEEMPGQRGLFQVLGWPYVEGLRLDEALHPLTLLAVGLYGETLPKQNGAPVRLVVPWKYGFKSLKSVVHIRLVETQPETSWNSQNPREYGFYANVNPKVDHPRWSQATERRIGEGGLFVPRRPTLLFNGYAEQVAGLYAGMDLSRFY